MSSPPDTERDARLAALEALLFTCTEPVASDRLAAAIHPEDPQSVLEDVEALRRRLIESDRGLELSEVAGGWRLTTKPEFSDLLQRFHRTVQRVRLSMASLETLSVIAYLQPVSTPEIETIRGVAVGQTVHGLVEKGLVRVLGRKDAPGRPLLYGTSEEFLAHFGLPHLDALPHSPELEKWKNEFRSGSREPASDPAAPAKPSSEKDA